MLSDFQQFLQSEYENVYRAAFALAGDRDVALEATQEAFARALARWRRLRGEPWRGGWVMTTALNICRTELKRARRTQAVLSPEANATNQETRRLEVVESLRALPPRQQQAVLLYYLADLPLSGVAAAMGISEGAVKSHLARGRDALRRHMQEGTSDAG